MKPILFLSVFLTLIVFGQNEPEAKHLRVIPLGQFPHWLEYLEDGNRKQILPKGAIPPEKVTLPTGKKKEVQTIPLNLGVMSKTMRLDGKIASLQFHEGEQGADQPWLQAPVHKSSRSLGVLFRDRQQMTWEKPRILLLDDSQEAFPPGNIRFVNVSDLTALVKVGKAAHAVRPGKSLILPLSEGSNKLMIGYQEKGSAKQVVIHESLTVKILANQRIQAFFYPSQDKNKDPKLQFKWLPEPPPAL